MHILTHVNLNMTIKQRKDTYIQKVNFACEQTCLTEFTKRG